MRKHCTSRTHLQQTQLLNLVALPQAVIQVVAQCNAHSVILLTTRSERKPQALHLLRRHRHLAHSQWIHLSLSENRLQSKPDEDTHHRLALGQTVRQSSARRSQSTTHDIGSGKNELDGALVHLHALHHIGS